MSLSTTINYDVPGNFTYNAANIEVTTTAHLLGEDDAGQTFNQPYTASAGFTFNATNTEFAAGKCQQKLVQQTNATIYCDYLVDEDAVYSDGVGTGTLNGGASVAGGKLDLTGGILAYCDYASASNFVGSNVGCINIKGYRPNYSGTPVSTQNLFDVNNGVNNNWRISVAHSTGTGNLIFALRDGAGATIHASTNFGVWNPTAGVSYDLEINWDVTTGATRMFITGNQFGATKTDTGTYTPVGLTTIRIGAELVPANLADYDIEGYIIYTTVQHTANFTPATLYRYYTDAVILPNFVYPNIESIQLYTAFATTDANTPHYNVNGKYWTGAAWAVSDDSYAQSNTTADINTNLSTFTPVADTVTMKLIWDDSDLKMDADDLTFTYTGRRYNTSNPDIIVNSGTLMDGLDGFLETAIKPGGSEVKYTLWVSGIPKWFNAGSWITSADNYTQANTAAEVQTNKAALDLSAGHNVRVKGFLHDTGQDNVILTAVNIDYNFFSPASYPNVCIVHDWVLDRGAPIAGVTVRATHNNTYEHGVNLLMIPKETTTDSNGYWELELYETASINKPVDFYFTYIGSLGRVEYSQLNLIIPDTSTVDFVSLPAFIS